MFDIPNVVVHGLWPLPWWGLLLVTLGFTHVTIAAVTIYLHRNQAHRALDLHPAVSHFFRFWLWLTTGMNTKEWAAIHRKHHAKCETAEDPHSPQFAGINTVMWEGTELYKKEAKNQETLAKYGKGTPEDWMERNVYTPRGWHGIVGMFVVDVALFGPIGITIWAIQMAWIPIFAAGIINGYGHYWGYRNADTPDTSTNLIPWGIFIGGEELHNNHHNNPKSAKFSFRRWEFDLGWAYIRAMEKLGLAKVKFATRIPVAAAVEGKYSIIPEDAEGQLAAWRESVDTHACETILENKHYVARRYRKFLLEYIRNAEKEATGEELGLLVRMRKLLAKGGGWSFVHKRSEEYVELREKLREHRSPSVRLLELKDKLEELFSGKGAHGATHGQIADWVAEVRAHGGQIFRKFTDWAGSLRSRNIKPPPSSGTDPPMDPPK